MQTTTVFALQHHDVLPVVHVDRVLQVVNILTTSTLEWNALAVESLPEISIRSHDKVNVDVVKL